MFIVFCFFFFKQKAAFGISACPVGSEIVLRGRAVGGGLGEFRLDLAVEAEELVFSYTHRTLRTKSLVGISGVAVFMKKKNMLRPIREMDG